jgi:hypothetical protein
VELILESPPALTPVILWLDRLPKRLQNATYAAFELEGGPLAVRKLREQFSKKDLIARGDTWRDWDYRVKRSGVEGVLLDVFNYQPDIVLLVIEKGRRKRRKAPPPEAILEWMDVRNIRPSDGETEEALAFLIGRKIAREGIPGRHPIEDAREDLRRRTDLSRVIGSYIDKEIAAL